MLVESTRKRKNQENLFTTLLNKFLPFWPYFLGLTILFLLFSWCYLKLATPIYGVSAKLIIKDEKKGVDDSKIMESINPFESKKIIENEIQVIQSKEVLDRVVDSLGLYAMVYEKSALKSYSAYQTSPIKIKIEHPDAIIMPLDGPVKHKFFYSAATKKVLMNEKEYETNTWLDFPFGRLMFVKNDRKQAENENPLYFELVHPKFISDAILNNLEVASADKLSTVVLLGYQDEDPVRGVDILNTIIYSYTNKAKEERNRLAENTLSFIEDRILNVEKELNNLEGEIQQFRASEGAFDLSEQGRLYLQDAGDNDRKIADINLQLTVLNRIESYVVSKSDQGGIVPSTSSLNDPVLSQLLQKLYNSEIEYARLRKTTAENNPMALSIADEIEKIRPSILENIKSQQSNLRASLNNLGRNSNKFNSALNSIPEKERALLEIKRREAMKSDLFSYLLQKREETALIYAPSEGDSKVIESANASINPISPNSKLAYAVAFVAAFGLAIAFVIAKELINNKVLFRSEIENATDLPILGEIGYVKDTKGTLFTVPKESMLIEQFRQLDAKLGLYSREMSVKNILVTSSISGEGKSFVSANLAYSLASLGKKVVLLDLDFRKPDTTVLFGLNENKGIVQFLKKEEALSELINKTEFDQNLHVVPAGTKGEDFTALLLNGRLETLFGQLNQQFDFVLIDSPPRDVTSDANLLAEYSDVALLVIRHSYTPKAIINRLDQVENNKLLASAQIVFNGVKARGFVKGAGYGYGYDQIAYPLKS